MRASFTIISLYLLFGFVGIGQPQFSLSTDSLLSWIESEQSKGDDLYDAGIFHSERYMLIGNHAHQDNNVFFTALTTYTLQELEPYLEENQKKITKRICDKAISCYPLYRSRNLYPTFNYWRVKPETPLPGSIWQNTNRARLPDDMDDSSLILLTGNNSDSLKKAFRSKMAHFTNNPEKPIKSIFKEYRTYNAYLTWFAEKLNQDFDICVIANTLLFIEKSDFKANAADSSSVALIVKMVENGDHLNYPEIISPYYENSAIIIHTLARLIAQTNNLQLLKLKPILIEDANQLLQKTDSRMEQMLLITSIYKLGSETQARVDLKQIENSFDGFSYFYTNPFHGSNMFWKRVFTKSRIFQLKARSVGFYYTLTLEYQFIINAH